MVDPPRAGRWAARRDSWPGRAGRSRRHRRLCRAESKIAGGRVGRLQSGAPDAGDRAQAWARSGRTSQPFASRISAHGPAGVTTISSPSSAPPISEFWKSPASNRPPGGESFVDQIDRARAGLARLPAGDAVLVVHSGTIRAVLAIALDLAPDSALRFVIDPLSLTRIDRLAAAGAWSRSTSVGCAHGWANARMRRAHHLQRARKVGTAHGRPTHPATQPFLRSPRSVGRPMPAASKPPSTARICPVM